VTAAAPRPEVRCGRPATVTVTVTESRSVRPAAAASPSGLQAPGQAWPPGRRSSRYLDVFVSEIQVPSHGLRLTGNLRVPEKTRKTLQNASNLKASASIL
jgi:hypothetical protein